MLEFWICFSSIIPCCVLCLHIGDFIYGKKAVMKRDHGRLSFPILVKLLLFFQGGESDFKSRGRGLASVTWSILDPYWDCLKGIIPPALVFITGSIDRQCNSPFPKEQE